jgi:translation initiation factor IF-1
VAFAIQGDRAMIQVLSKNGRKKSIKATVKKVLRTIKLSSGDFVVIKGEDGKEVRIYCSNGKVYAY